MPTPVCPKCRRVIPSADINVANDVAYCRDCNLSHRLSDLTDFADGGAVDLNHPPSGTWQSSTGTGVVVGASNRNFPAAIGLLFFALFWNGIVSVFVALALAGTLKNLRVPLPAWFPKPEMNGGEMGPGMVVFLWLFLTPFILIGLAVAGSCLSSLFGRTEIRVENSQGTVFTGVGPLGWRRRFDASQVQAVRMIRRRNNEGSDSFVVAIETRAGKLVKFGSLLANERRQFLLGTLRQLLVR